MARGRTQSHINGKGIQDALTDEVSQEDTTKDVRERLKEIELLLRKLLVQAELVTDTFINEEDLR